MAEKCESNKELVEGKDYVKPLSGLHVKVNVDCSDALRGLKAITRAAKKATAALNELEQQQKKMNKPINVDINMNAQEIARVVSEKIDINTSRAGRF